MTPKLNIPSPTEWTGIEESTPPKDAMLLLSGVALDEEGKVVEGLEVITLGFWSSRSNTYIRVDSSAECLSEWMIPLRYHVVYSPSGDMVSLSSSTDNASAESE